MAKGKKVTKITIGLIASWIFGILFLFGGFGAITEGSITIGILVIIGSIFLIPVFDDLIKEKFNIEISGGVKFALVVVMLILISFSSVGESRRSSDVEVQSTEEPPTTTVKKIKSGTISIDKVTVTVANLNKIRITIKNTGDVSFTPKFDVYAISSSGETVCEDSPFFGVGSISAGKQITDEIQLLGCSFNKDGDYTIKVNMLDEDYKKLDSGQKTVTVNYWGQFGVW